jgi:hypothetical protein
MGACLNNHSPDTISNTVRNSKDIRVYIPLHTWYVVNYLCFHHAAWFLDMCYVMLNMDKSVPYLIVADHHYDELCNMQGILCTKLKGLSSLVIMIRPVIIDNRCCFLFNQRRQDGHFDLDLSPVIFVFHAIWKFSAKALLQIGNDSKGFVWPPYKSSQSLSPQPRRETNHRAQSPQPRRETNHRAQSPHSHRETNHRAQSPHSHRETNHRAQSPHSHRENTHSVKYVW